MARREALWYRRMLEWGILALVVLALATVLAVYAYRVRGQAERAAIISTLGALRTALVLNHVQRATTQPAAAPDSNPFGMLERPPVNYAGRLGTVQRQELEPGRWVFDAACVCVGYKPMNPEWLDGELPGGLLWFQVLEHDHGLLELRASQNYSWQGQIIL